MKVLQLILLALVFTSCSEAPEVSIPPIQKLQQKQAGLHKLHADVPGVGKVKYAIDIPKNLQEKAVPLVLLLHYGYDGKVPDAYTGAGMIDTFKQGLNELGAITIAPDVIDGDWTAAKNETAAVWLIKSAIKTYNIDTKNIIIAGYSMGGEGSWYIGSRHQDLFTVAIPIAAPLALNKPWKIPVYVIHSDADKAVSYLSAKKNAENLKESGIEIEFKNAKGLDHFDTRKYGSYFLEAVKWLKARQQ